MWHHANQQPLPAYLTKETAKLGIKDVPWAAIETRYTRGDNWYQGWLLFTDRRILLFQTDLGFKSMEEYSYNDDLAIADRPLSSKKWFVLRGRSFMMSAADAQYLYQFVDHVLVQRAKRKAEQKAAGAAPQQGSKADELAKLAQLLQDGVLTQAEFDAEKARVLSS